ncbi:hypothetical protein B7R22_10920 [Subtercola boreus]|uniref:Uncharacterized protein n=2 Tax=Subtercola boreus TaxID=120213 RepID=A0A3E0VWZ0_9MICO|nr:hypothetical protein B7R22_10920 [Subtercola boreus]
MTMARSLRIPLSSKVDDEHGRDTHAGEPLAPDVLLTIDDHQRFGDGTLWSFAGVEVVDIVQSPTSPIPIFRHVSPVHGDRIAVVFLLEGEVQVTHDGALFRFLPGSAAYIVTGTATSVEASETCRAVMVSLRRRRLAAAGIDVHQTFGAFAASTARTSPLLTFTLALIEVVSVHSLPTEPTATALTELVAGLFRADDAYSTRSLGSGPDVEFEGYRETVRASLLEQLEEGSAG